MDRSPRTVIQGRILAALCFGGCCGGISSRWPFVLVAVVVGFLLAAVAPRRAPSGRIETLEMLEEIEQERKLEKLTYISFGLFFWMALFVLVTAIIVRYAL
jgi:hypothetical protein